MNIAGRLSEYAIKIHALPIEDGGGYKANYDELALTVSGYGETPSLAAIQLREVAEEVLADEPLSSLPPPRKPASWESYSGRVTLRLPKSLHARLDTLAKEQGVSLNHLMSDALETVATQLSAR